MIAPSIESTTVTPRSRPKGQAVQAPLGLPTSIAPRKRPTAQGKNLDIDMVSYGRHTQIIAVTV